MQLTTFDLLFIALWTWRRLAITNNLNGWGAEDFRRRYVAGGMCFDFLFLFIVKFVFYIPDIIHAMMK